MIKHYGPNFGRYRTALANGNIAALYDVLMLCAARDDQVPKLPESDPRRLLLEHPPEDGMYSVEVPRWALDGAIRLLREALPLLPSKSRKGRHARWVQQFRQDMIDDERWNSVDEWHRAGFGWKDHPRAMGDDADLRIECPACKSRDNSLDEYHGPPFWWTCVKCRKRWRPKGSVFRKAAEQLEGTFAAGSPDQIEASWKRVKRRARSTPGRYLRPNFITWPGREY